MFALQRLTGEWLFSASRDVHCGSPWNDSLWDHTYVFFLSTVLFPFFFLPHYNLTLLFIGNGSQSLYHLRPWWFPWKEGIDTWEMSEHKKEICSYYCRELISNGKKAMFWILVQEGRTGKDMGYRKRNSERQGTWCLRKGAAFHGPAEGNQSCWVKEHIKQGRADGRVGTEYSCGPVHFPSFQSMNEVLSKI